MSESAGRFTQLPARVPLEDTLESVASDTAPDPLFGRDPETEFLLRNAE